MSEEVDLTDLQRMLQELEDFRKKSLKKLLRFRKIRRFYKWIITLFFIAAILTLIFVVILPFTLPLLIGGGVIFIVDLIINGRLTAKEDEFFERFKNEVMPAAVASTGEKLTYSFESTIDKELFQRTYLVDERIDKFYVEDMIEGKFGPVKFRCSEVRAGKMVLSAKKVAGEVAEGCLAALLDMFFGLGDDDGSNDEYDTHKYVKCFHGLLVISDFHKSFEGSVLLRPKGATVSEQVKSTHHAVAIGDVNFDNKYDVYTTDKVLARYVLSPYLIQQIDLLDDHCPDALLASFLNGRMCLGLPQEKDLFEASFYKGVPDISAFEELVQEIEVIARVLDHLDQNTRIWGDKAMPEA